MTPAFFPPGSQQVIVVVVVVVVFFYTSSVCVRSLETVPAQTRPDKLSQLLKRLERIRLTRSFKGMGLPLMNVVRMKSVPILRLLHLEERLLRTSSENWFIVNDGTIHPTVVMGVSGRLTELVDLRSVLRDGIAVIRRFTGGGTVIVDKGTIFTALICNKDDIPGVQPYPRPIMSWTGELYGEVFRGFGDFHLRENDYVFEARKFGGNAQSITKDRWIHHTSFLWDYDVNNMNYLKLPMRAPEYRLARDHVEFLCCMKEYLPSRPTFIDRAIASLQSHFSIRHVAMENILDPTNASFSPSTKLLTEQELEEAYSTQCGSLR